MPAARRADPPITLSEERGVRYLHFGTPWIQGAMRIRRPFEIEIDYVRDMMAWLLFLEPPPRILQLGLGAAALTKFCHRRCARSELTVVEASGAVIDAARLWFALPPDDARLRVIEADAGDAVAAPRMRGRFGVVQADLYDMHARGPAIETQAFYEACRAAIAAPGMFVANLFGEHDSYARNERRIRRAFDDRVLTLPPVPAGNVVALAFSGPPVSVEWAALERRAAELERDWRLPARAWVAGLRARHGGAGELLSV